jgi:uncharacterized hydrophobic protein (TIGR00271 family)
MLLLSQNPNRFRGIIYIIFRKYLIYKKNLGQFWNNQSGEWRWLQEKPIPIAGLNRNLWRLAVPSFSFHFMLGLSSIIATLGLLANSAAIIIGAMIIAPLMGPIIGIAYSMVVANRRLLRRSSLTLLSGVILTIVTAYVATFLVGLRTVNTEILARTNPTLLDLGIALAAGAAGAFATSRKRIADALPGVAIAVALVPPLSVIGIGLALNQINLAVGALVLFLTNLTGIVFSGGIVFVCQSYGNMAKARQGLLFSVCALCLLGIPLTLSLRDLLIQDNVRRTVVRLVRGQVITFAGKEIRTIRVSRESALLLIEIEVAAPSDSISQNQVNLVRDFLSRQLGRPVDLQVRIFPVDTLQAPAIAP